MTIDVTLSPYIRRLENSTLNGDENDELVSGIVGRWYTKQAYGWQTARVPGDPCGHVSFHSAAFERSGCERANRDQGQRRSIFRGERQEKAAEAAVETGADGAVKLKQIVVTATGFEQNITDAPASITVIPGEELEKGVYRDLTDALKDVQGVAVTGPAAEKDIFIRGLPGSYTLLLVDGKRQSTRDARTNGNSGFEQSFLPPANAIERIEVIRGPMSSLYGSDAMGGVINVITKRCRTRGAALSRSTARYSSTPNSETHCKAPTI